MFLRFRYSWLLNTYLGAFTLALKFKSLVRRPDRCKVSVLSVVFNGATPDLSVGFTVNTVDRAVGDDPFGNASPAPCPYLGTVSPFPRRSGFVVERPVGVHVARSVFFGHDRHFGKR